SASHHLQGFWMIYGVFLPKEVLEKIYYKNAEKVLLAAPRGKAFAEGEAGAAAPARSEPKAAEAAASALPEDRVSAVDDFEITGKGDAPAWRIAPWGEMTLLGSEPLQGGYTTRFKLLRSAKGIYLYFEGEDQRVTSTMEQDNLDL